MFSKLIAFKNRNAWTKEIPMRPITESDIRGILDNAARQTGCTITEVSFTR